MKNHFIKINNILTKIDLNPSIKNIKTALAFLRETSKNLIRAPDEIKNLILKKIKDNPKEFTMLFSLIQRIISSTDKNHETFSTLGEFSYALWLNKNYFYDSNNYEFLKFLIMYSISLNIAFNTPNEAMEKYIELNVLIEKMGDRDYSNIFSSNEILTKLDILWEENFKNIKWGYFQYFKHHRDFFFDVAGAIGNLAYLRWNIRKSLNFFKDFKSEFEFVIEEVYDILNNNSSAIAVYFFFEVYWVSLYTIKNDEKESHSNLYNTAIKELSSKLDSEFNSSHLTLYKFYTEASKITLNIDHFKKLIYHWSKFNEVEYNSSETHHKYIYTTQYLERLEENILYLANILKRIHAEKNKKIFDLASKFCWILVKNLEKEGLPTWAIKTILDLDILKSKKRKKYLIKKRNFVFEQTVLEYESRINDDFIRIEYFLSKNHFIFYLDKYIIIHYIPNYRKISFLQALIEKFQEKINNKFLWLKYKNLELDISLEIRDYNNLNKCLNDLDIVMQDKFSNKKDIITLKLLEIQLNIIKQWEDKASSIKEEKSELLKKMNSEFNDENPFDELKRQELNPKIELTFMYLQICSNLDLFLKYLKNWYVQLLNRKTIIPSDWNKQLNNFYIDTFKLDLFFLEMNSLTDLKEIIFGIKSIYLFLYQLSLILQEISSGQKILIDFQTEFKIHYEKYANESKEFSNLIKQKKKSEENALENLRFHPLIIPLRFVYGLEENDEIRIVNFEIDKINREILLNLKVSKKILFETINYPRFFINNQDYSQDLNFENIEIGIIWNINKSFIVSSISNHDFVGIYNGHYSFVINIKLPSDIPDILFIVPYIQNKIYQERIFGHRKIINISNYRNISTNLSLFPSFFQNKIELFCDLSGENPSLQLNSYIQILDLLLRMILSFERTSNPIKNMSEPEIRDLFLVYLNLYFKGFATGETFNKKGKTDILIRYNNSNLFIAECKFWKGPESMIKTINQLFNYITWRDTKICIIFLNKNKNFSAVLSKINNTIQSHPNFIKESLVIKNTIENNESVFSYIFKHPDNNEREIILSILSYDI